MFDVVLKLFLVSSSTIGIGHYGLSQKLSQFIVIFFQTIFNMSHLEHLLSVLRTPAIIAFHFLGGPGTHELVLQEVSCGQIVTKLRPVVKSARKTAGSYCHKIEAGISSVLLKVGQRRRIHLGRQVTLITRTVMVKKFEIIFFNFMSASTTRVTLPCYDFR